MAARRGAAVTAIDASAGMVARIAARAVEAGMPVRAAVMDAHALELPDQAFTDALSIFGLILCTDPVAALREIHRVLVPAGRVAIVTWTDPGRYELITRLLAAIEAVCGARPAPTVLPAQLRFAEEARFRALFEAAAFDVERIERIEARLTAPSAAWLATHLDFAPGVAAMLSGLGPDRAAVVARFVADMVRDQGPGPIALGAVAFLGLGRRL
jgi:ubiquinone/menaquinone biosynthesis C-methylase UbiE